MPVITVQQARDRDIQPASLLAVAKWNREAAKKARKPHDRNRYQSQAKALEAVAKDL